MSETEMNRDPSVLFTRICELALRTRDGVSIKGLPGAWSYRFDDARGNEWQVAVNGHGERAVDSPLSPGSVIDPFDAHIYFNGWPFAILDPFGRGTIGHGESANEDTCIAALEAEGARLAADSSRV